MDIQKVVGTGVILKTVDGDFLLQERDLDLKRNPGMIALFGGGIEIGETSAEGAARELEEELELVVTAKDLQPVGVLKSHFTPGTHSQIFLVTNVNPDMLVLHEGRAIKVMSLHEALANAKVTNFTKEALRLP